MFMRFESLLLVENIKKGENMANTFIDALEIFYPVGSVYESINPAPPPPLVSGRK